MKPARLLSLAVVLLHAVSPAFAMEMSDAEELRLRLPDPSQEIRTTSLNWFDLPLKVAPRHAHEDAEPLELERPPIRVVIDPGHGGRDYGARGTNGLVEKALCLKLGHLVKKQLERMGKFRDQPVEVRLTREEDRYLALRDRVKAANDWGADLFVSIHGNSADVEMARGFEVYFLSIDGTDRAARKLARLENETEPEPIKSDVLSILSDVQATNHVNESSAFAESVFRAMASRLRANGRGVRQAPFAVLTGTTMPALLLEVGYLTHDAEARNLARLPYLKRLASGISAGILEFAAHGPRRSTL